MTRRHWARAAIAAALAFPLAACGSDPSGTQRGSSPGATGTGTNSTDAAVIASELQAPWSIAFYRGLPLVSERDSGRILELPIELDGDPAPREVGTVDGVAARGEGGLLGLAVHDDWLYAYFTSDDDNRVQRFPLSGEPGSITLGEPETILEGMPAASVHNGGRIAFGPDGMLYVTAGDAGDREAAQDRDSLAGKILRLTPDGDVPADNPYAGSPVYSYGHRNPQGLAWAPDGTLYSSEFGQNTWDELNVIRPGANYGWPVVEGIAGDPRFVDPVQQWVPSEASPSGIAIADGQIWIANLRGQRLRTVPLDDPTSSSEQLTDAGRLRDVVVAPNGAVWVLTNNTDGRGSPRAGDDRILRLR